MHPIRGSYKLTEATTNKGYIDQLVIKYIVQNIGLEILASAPEQKRPAIFLNNVGWGQKKDYIEDTLNAYLSDKLPSVVYVFTPNDSFKYVVTAHRVNNEGIRSSRDGKSTFEDAVKDLMEHVGQNLSAGKESIAYMLFFDKASRDKFKDALRRRLKEKSETLSKRDLEIKKISYSVTSQQLNVPDYGTIMLYNYTIKQSPPPSK